MIVNDFSHCCLKCQIIDPGLCCTSRDEATSPTEVNYRQKYLYWGVCVSGVLCHWVWSHRLIIATVRQQSCLGGSRIKTWSQHIEPGHLGASLPGSLWPPCKPMPYVYPSYGFHFFGQPREHSVSASAVVRRQRCHLPERAVTDTTMAKN